MKSLIAIAAMLISVGAMANPAEEAAIKQSFQSFTKAWNAHDVKGMAAWWTDDGDVINPSGRVAKGKADIEKMFTDEHTGGMKTTTATMDVVGFRFIGADLAFVDGEMNMSGVMSPEGKAMPPMKFHIASLMKKDGGTWKNLDTRPYAFLPPPAAKNIAAKKK